MRLQSGHTYLSKYQLFQLRLLVVLRQLNRATLCTLFNEELYLVAQCQEFPESLAFSGFCKQSLTQQADKVRISDI